MVTEIVADDEQLPGDAKPHPKTLAVTARPASDNQLEQSPPRQGPEKGGPTIRVRLLPYLRDTMSPAVETQDDAWEFLPRREAPTWLNEGKDDPIAPGLP